MCYEKKNQLKMMTIVCVMIWMIATDTVAMNFTMYMHESDIWCKMKNGSRDGAKWNMAAGDAKWKWQLMVQKWERNQRMQNKDDQQMMKAKKWL